MSAPVTTDDLLALVRKSGLVEPGRLDACLARLAEDGSLSADPRRLVGLLIRDGLLTFFQGEQLLLGKWRGFAIGKYRILERIGIGGMGQVFLCEHQFMRRRVAIKVLPPLKAQDPAALGRFYREGRAAAALDHPNIVRAHDLDRDNHLHFLVMEYVDGTSLLDVVKRTGPMPWPRAAQYAWQAAAGLRHAHAGGVIHRDIKPGNLMVDRQGVVKVLDMGLARFYEDTSDMLTQMYDERSVLGTADYVAPEQTTDSHNVDARADIYGLGATTYFLLAGHPPFPDGTIPQKLLAHQTKPPRPIRELRPDVPEGLAAVLHTMLAKAPAERYPSPAELEAALAPWAAEPVPPPADEEMPHLSPLAAADPTGPAPIPTPAGPVKESGVVRPELLPPRPTLAQRHARPPSLADYNLTPPPQPLPRLAAAVRTAPAPVPAVLSPAAAADTDRRNAAHQDTAAPRLAPPLPSLMQVQALLDQPPPRAAHAGLAWVLAALLGAGVGVGAWFKFASPAGPAAKPAVSAPGR